MSATTTKPIAAGEPAVLAEFQQVVAGLWQNHRTAPVAAGDERIYTFWGTNYKIVVNERLFDALVEVDGPEGMIQIKPNEQGELTAQPADAKVTAAPQRVIENAITDVQEYWARKALFRQTIK